MQYFVFGPSGSGKNTEVFDTFMIPAFLTQKEPDGGRDVFGNIGVDREKLEQLLGYQVRYHFIGRDEIRNPLNWPMLGDPGEDGRRQVIPGKLFTPGCMIIVDEARTVWRKNENVDPRILDSLDTQRHFSTAAGYGIDVIWIGLTKRQFHGDIRENAEAYYKISPVEELRIKDAHRLTIFSEFRCGKEDIVGTPSKIINHNKGYYGLYYSVEEGVAARHVLDERIAHSRFRPKHFIWAIAGVSLAAIIAVVIFIIFTARTFTADSAKSIVTSQEKNNGHLVETCMDPVVDLGGGRRFVVDGTGADTNLVAYDGRCRTKGAAAKPEESYLGGAGFIGNLGLAGGQGG